jgi:hypothetical protein
MTEKKIKYKDVCFLPEVCCEDCDVCSVMREILKEMEKEEGDS